MSKETILKEFEEKSMSDFYKKENNNYNDKYRKAFNISKSFKVVKYPREVDFKIIRNFISKAIDQTREETIREEIAYWIDVFDNRPKDRDLESDNIAQNFARIEIERLENKLKK